MYDKIPIGDREYLSWEAMAIAAKVNLKHLLGAIRVAIQNHCENRSRFIAVSNHPDIMKARVGFGTALVGAEKDRTAIEMGIGWLQGPKSPQFIGKQVAIYNAGGSSPKDDEGNTIGSTPSFYQGGDLEDRIFGTPQSNTELDNKIIKIRDRRLEGL